MVPSPTYQDDEDAVFTRPTEDQIRSSWKNLFEDPLLSMNALKWKALNGLAEEGRDLQVDNWVPLRSLHWKLHHSILPSPSPSLFPTPLSTSRATYDTLRARYLRAPDGRWAADVSVPDGAVLVENGAEGKGGDLGRNNPLSLEEENPWTSWFSDVDLRKVIRQDVERTFPDIPYFTLPRVQTLLTTILFLYSVLHPDVGYRQGMHELAAAILLVVDLDSAPSSDASSNSNLQQDLVSLTLSREYVEHDTWTLYENVMKHAKGWYQWREEEASGGGATKIGGRRQAPKKLEQPIVTICNHMHGTLLRSLDPQLWAKMEELGIEPQIYGIRWIRLIFTREFPLDDAMRLWDGIFAEDSTLRLVEFICIAMLLRIRNFIVHADYSEALSTLLRYPTASPPLSIPLLLSQAIALRDSSASPATGVAVVMQNQDLLGIPAQPPPPEEDEYDSRRRRGGGGGGGRGGGRGGRPPPLGFGAAGRIAQVQMGFAGLGLGDVAKGLLERGQALGLDKAIISRVTEIRNNLPDFPTSPSGLNRPTSFTPTSSFSSLAQSPPLTTHLQQQTRRSQELEAEVVSLRSTMHDMSIVMAKCLEGVENELFSRPPVPDSTTEEDRTAAGGGPLSVDVALSGLRLIREALRDPSHPFDPSVIFSQEDSALDSSVLPTPPLPAETSSTPSQPQSIPAPSTLPPPTLPPPTLPLPSSFPDLIQPQHASTSSPQLPISAPTPSLPSPPPTASSPPLPPPQAHAAPPPPLTSRRSHSTSSHPHPQLFLSSRNDQPSQGLSRSPTPNIRPQLQAPQTPLPSAIGFASSSNSNPSYSKSNGRGGPTPIPPPPWVRTTSSFAASSSSTAPTPVLPQYPPKSSFGEVEGDPSSGSGVFSRFAGGGGLETRGSRDPLVGERPVAVVAKLKGGDGLARFGGGETGAGGGDPLGAL